jgi:hypothetical protein
MEIDFSAPICDFDGNASGKTIGDCVLDALMAPLPGDDKLSAGEKVAQFKLALKVHGAQNLTVSLEETALIKLRVGQAFPPLVVGRVFEALGEL